MLRTFGESRGFRAVMVGLLVGVAAIALAVDPADAKGRRRSKKTSSYSPPYSAIVVDANSGKVLHAAEADGIRHPASLTKIMTLYLLFERMETGKIKTDTQLKVSAHAASQSPTKLGLKAGDTIELQQGPVRRTVVVRGISALRGPAPVAQQLYEETAASIAERERAAEQRRLAPEPALSIAHGRPTKRDRRELGDKAWGDRWSASIDD